MVLVSNMKTSTTINRHSIIMTANLAWYLVEHASIEYNESGLEPS
jgi:hypothetical protein